MPPITNRGDLMARTWQVSLHIQPRPVSQHSTNTVSVGSQALCGIPAEMHWVDCLPLSLLATVVRTSTMASPPKDRGAPAVQKHGAVSRSMLSLMPIPRRDHEGLLRVGELQADHGRYRQASSGPRRRTGGMYTSPCSCWSTCPSMARRRWLSPALPNIIYTTS